MRFCRTFFFSCLLFVSFVVVLVKTVFATLHWITVSYFQFIGAFFVFLLEPCRFIFCVTQLSIVSLLLVFVLRVCNLDES